MDRPISTLMTSPVQCVRLDDSSSAIQARMSAQRLNWLPVIDDNGTVLGVIDAGDLLGLHAQGRDASTTPAWRLCRYSPIQVSPDTPIGDVAALMIDRGVRHVVVTGNGAVCGVVSSSDFVRLCAAGRRPARMERAAARA